MPKNNSYYPQPNSYPPATNFLEQNPGSQPKPPKKITLILIVVIFFSIIAAGYISLATKVTSLLVWDQSTSSLLSNWEAATLDNQGDIVTSVAFSPDGK